MHNVEYKAELRDLSLARSICAALKATFIGELAQTDTYYRIPSGRLKKREQTLGGEAEPVEYIFYDRPDRAKARLSHFTIYSESQAQERFGTQPLPVWLVVRKKRELFMLGNVRIHLDQVEGLGAFLEFEAVVARDHTIARCHETVASMREHFQPALGEAIAVSYSDMIEGLMEREPAE